jgi:hypothetical protein
MQIINVTFVVQIINFFLTCYFLHKLILRPTVDILDERENLKTALKKRIDFHEDLLEKFIVTKNKNLEAFQQQMKRYYAEQKISLFRQEDEMLCSYDEQKVSDIVNTSVKIIVKKVESAY